MLMCSVAVDIRDAQEVTLNLATLPVAVAGFLNLFQRKEEEDESELITTIKRAVLMIQRDEFKVAEQLLHVALKLAQEQQNEDGVTYIYDLMANLAFAQGEFTKAEKLFVQTMQRVIRGGAPQDDIKVLHMSLKLAKICEEKQKYEEAEVGYEFCVNTLEKKVEHDPHDEDLLTLWAMSLDWYARFLLDKNRLSEAFSYFKKAYNMCLKVNGEIHEQTVVLLNDLGSVSFLKGDHGAAMDYLTKAVEIGKHLPNMNDFSSVYVNLGNVCLQQKMYEEAKRHCKEGKQNATRHNNPDGIQEANLCLEELSKVWRK
ncbi:hypothetical protein GE061_010144 [Apolygus lucorum]|uniref:MalT-like TPR region domain-containing protein n=1 Tax=Apolygus lucorum TaxID=248454 RepID=A0A8S9Y280_APOLU|nr:hypothetical protein GE061_010144 [Apolygus lucorum]